MNDPDVNKFTLTIKTYSKVKLGYANNNGLIETTLDRVRGISNVL